MDISNWHPFLKIDADDLTRCMAQQTYEPLINPEGTVFCANYDWTNSYQRREDPIRPLYTSDAVDYFFNKEVENVLKYKNKEYAPEIIDIDYKLKRLYFKWYGETCNEIIYSGRDLSEKCHNWKDQIKNILVDLYNSGTYKLTMYPHCHYIDNDGNMRAIDWYGCVPTDDFCIETKYMDSIIHETAIFRLKETGDLVDGKYNLESMFKNSMSRHVKWGNYSMRYIYDEIFKERSNA